MHTAALLATTLTAALLAPSLTAQSVSPQTAGSSAGSSGTAAVGVDSVRMSAVGTVQFSNIPTGAFAFVNASAQVSMSMEVAYPGFVTAPGQYVNYSMLPNTFSLKIADASVGMPGGTTIGLQNDYPAVDGVHLFSSQMSSFNYWMEFELFGGSGDIFTSPDAALEYGTYVAPQFGLADWNVFGGGGQMVIAFESFTISAVETEWTNLDGGSLGAAGVPKLTGSGQLTPGSATTLDIADAPASTLTLVVLSTNSMPVDVIGGTLHAFPFTAQVMTSTSPAGSVHLATAWPAGVPSGTELWFQFVVQDATSIHGLTLSNGVTATVP